MYDWEDSNLSQYFNYQDEMNEENYHPNYNAPTNSNSPVHCTWEDEQFDTKSNTSYPPPVDDQFWWDESDITNQPEYDDWLDQYLEEDNDITWDRVSFDEYHPELEYQSSSYNWNEEFHPHQPP